MSQRLFVISAPSGAGKTTLCRRLLADFPVLTLSISTTTRAPRGSERDGQDYFFVDKDEFERRIAADEFAEWALVHGSYYGTSKKVIREAFAAGKSVLLDIDVQGAESLRRSFPKECISIFVAPPDLAVLEARLRARKTDSEDSIQKRLKNARAEMEEMPKFHRVVVNDELERAYAELRQLVAREVTG